MALGAGRRRLQDAIDHAAWVRIERKVGERVEAGAPLARFSVAREGALGEAVRAQLQRAFTVEAEAPPPRPLVLEVVR
jgi:thymidine phosphorylase